MTTLNASANLLCMLLSSKCYFKDSSMPFVEIAKQIGISDATVHLRVRRLISADVITKFTISVDNNLLGYDHLAFMGINIKPGSADQTTKELSYLFIDIKYYDKIITKLLELQTKEEYQQWYTAEEDIAKTRITGRRNG